jgi:hypothetical protein
MAGDCSFGPYALFSSEVSIFAPPQTQKKRFLMYYVFLKLRPQHIPVALPRKPTNVVMHILYHFDQSSSHVSQQPVPCRNLGHVTGHGRLCRICFTGHGRFVSKPHNVGTVNGYCPVCNGVFVSGVKFLNNLSAGDRDL